MSVSRLAKLFCNERACVPTAARTENSFADFLWKVKSLVQSVCVFSLYIFQKQANRAPKAKLMKVKLARVRGPSETLIEFSVCVGYRVAIGKWTRGIMDCRRQRHRNGARLQ